ncbi:hypothetical protein I4U23_029909 [Adineta vaga]|nr:hypothetical protein I4U23_029909 [Adineta vaga]
MNDVCTCSCHADPGIRHIMACCQTCSSCKQRVVSTELEEHKKKCQTQKSK